MVDFGEDNMKAWIQPPLYHWFKIGGRGIMVYQFSWHTRQKQLQSGTGAAVD